MNILIACEESGRVCQAFRERGHQAFSCDIKPTSGNLPQYHIQDDVLNILYNGWDMLIGFPPCTYFSKMNFLNYYRNGKFNYKRFDESKKYVDLFNSLYNAPIKYICLENPRPMTLFKDLLPPPSMRLQPYEFGESYSKETFLWLKNLPYLMPTLINYNYRPLITVSNSFESAKTIEEQSTIRSRTPWSIAYAMANQWG